MAESELHDSAVETSRRPFGRPRVAGEDRVDFVARVADGLEAEIEVIVQEIFAAGREARVLPVLSSTLEEALELALDAGIRDAVERLRTRAAHPSRLPHEVDDLARHWARRGCDLASLIDVVDLARDVTRPWFERLAEDALPDAEARWALITRAQRGLAGWTRATNRLLRESYEAECETVLQRTRGDRGRLVARILAGDLSDDTDLGYDLSLQHLAVIAWGDDAPTRVKALALRSGRRLLIVDGPGDNVWGWLGGWSELSSDDVADLVTWQREEGGHTAFGEPSPAVNGFRTSHAQALEAQAVALARGDSVVRYDDAALIAIASRDQKVAAAFVSHELGDLARSDARSRELRDTLRVYLENGQSVTATQALRGLNRNTIRHQLDEAQARLRHRIVGRSAELLVALRLIHTTDV